jgi:protoheme ferro-lyase
MKNLLTCNTISTNLFFRYPDVVARQNKEWNLRQDRILKIVASGFSKLDSYTVSKKTGIQLETRASQNELEKTLQTVCHYVNHLTYVIVSICNVQNIWCMQFSTVKKWLCKAIR